MDKILARSVLPPLASYLDPREADQAVARPLRDSVNIPLAELESRMHELPSRKEPVVVAASSPLAETTVRWLADRGREATAVPPEPVSPRDSRPARLWQPNPFLMTVLPGLQPGRALDLGCGAGRDAVALASFGWQVTAVDVLPDALDLGRRLAARYLPAGQPRIEWAAMDLERDEVEFSDRFELITSFFYLNRPMLQRIARYLSPGGSIVLETFTTVHRSATGKPRREHLALEPGELRSTPDVSTLLLDEGWHGDRHTARWWARSLRSE